MSRSKLILLEEWVKKCVYQPAGCVASRHAPQSGFYLVEETVNFCGTVDCPIA